VTVTATGDYTFSQLEQLWIQAGGAASLAPVMAAIALAESSGNPDAVNPTDNNGTQTSWGLWQISNGTHNMPVPGILSPLTNAQQAVAKLQSQGLSAWGTYDSGAYKQYLPAGTTATLTSSTSSSGATAGGGQGGAPYTPSSVPGIPSTPPAFPDFTLNPYNELSRVLSWTTEFGGWALFTLIVLVFGMILLVLGVLMVVLLLAAPVADPVAEVVGGGVVGGALEKARGASKRGATAAGAGQPAPTTPSGYAPPKASTRSETGGARHAARGAHAPGAQSRVPSKVAVSRHNAAFPGDREPTDREIRAMERRNAELRSGRRPVKGQRSFSIDDAPRARRRAS
jgi:hypothetical protein